MPSSDPAGKAAPTSLVCSLDAGDVTRLQALVDSAPASAAIATWIETRRLVWVGIKFDSRLIGWTISPADDELEGQAIGRALAELLARAYVPARDANKAAQLLIRRLSH